MKLILESWRGFVETEAILSLCEQRNALLREAEEGETALQTVEQGIETVEQNLESTFSKGERKKYAGNESTV